jgi:hypothetical protein
MKRCAGRRGTRLGACGSYGARLAAGALRRIAFAGVHGGAAAEMTLLSALVMAATLLPAVPVVQAGEHGGGASVVARTATSETFDNGDGTFTRRIASEPERYRDAQGKWRAIDSRLVPSWHSIAASGFKANGGADGDYAWRNAANSFSAQFRQRLEPNFLRLGRGRSAFLLSLADAAPVGAAVDGAAVVYRDVFPDVDLRYDVTATGVKESLVLRSPAAAARFEFVLRSEAGSRLAAQRNPDGSWRVASADDPYAEIELAPPTVSEDGANVPVEDAPVALHLGRSDAGYRVSLALDQRWLKRPGRKFPLVVDPTLTLPHPSTVGQFYGNCSTCRGTPNSPWYVGTNSSYSYRLGMDFDVGSLLPGTQISSATLRLYQDSSSCLDVGKCGSDSHHSTCTA